MSKEEEVWNDLLKAGDDIMKSVNRALDSGDFSRLNSQITNSVERAKRSTANRYQNPRPNGNQSTYGGPYQKPGQTASRPGQSAPRPGQSAPRPGQSASQRPPQRPPRPNQYQTPPRPRPIRTPYRPGSGINININTGTGRTGNSYSNNTTSNYSTSQTNVSSAQKFEMTPFIQTKVSKSNGNNGMVGGAIGMFIFGGSALSSLTDFMFYGGDLAGTVILAGLAIWSASVFFKGRKKKKLAQEFYKYANIVGQRTYIEIDELARVSTETKETVLANLKKMMQDGLLPQAMLDEEETTLMLTNDVYQAYLENKEQQKKKAAEASAKKKEEESLSEEERAVLALVEEGNSYIKKIHDANDAIPDDVMSEKLDRLESIMTRIFDQVKTHPETAGNLRKLMDYYLPTIEKLLNAYISLDKQPEVGTNITQTKKQIEEVLDTVNDAFENLLDSMFSDLAWDISSDISVMQTMLKQDGLAGESIRDK